MGGLDINWFRADKGHDPNVIKLSLKKRYRDDKLVDVIIEKDKEWRQGISHHLFSSIQSRLIEERMERHWQAHQG